MEINETEVLICNCGETMPLDPKKIGDGCNLESKPKIFNSFEYKQSQRTEGRVNI